MPPSRLPSPTAPRAGADVLRMLGAALAIALALLALGVLAVGAPVLAAGPPWLGALDALSVGGPGDVMLVVTVLLSVVGLFVAVAAAPTRGRR